MTSYDMNGNIRGLVRNGYVYYNGYNITNGIIDNLSITYSGNQKKNVSDAAQQHAVVTTNDFDDVYDSNFPEEYLYDKNGNMTADLNKGIAWIRYNVINLPEKVQFRNGTKNEYSYDATGIKRSAGYNYSTNSSLIPLGDTDPAKENTANSSFRTDYCGNYIYEKSGTMAPRLKRIKTPEGYVNVYGGMLSYIGYWTYVYALKDYQGSTRVTLTSAYLKNTGSLTYSSSEQIDYYPFGLERSNTGQSSGGVFNSGTNPYLYSANEIDRLNGLHQYDFHARWLDAAVPGFSTPDPLSERHYNENPYAYCGLDPVNRIDPLGLDWYYNEDKGYQWFENMTSSNYRYGFKINGATWLYAGTTVYYTDKKGNEYYGDEKGKLHKMSVTEFTVWGSSSYSLYGFAASGYDGNSGNYYDDSEGGGNGGGTSSSGGGYYYGNPESPVITLIGSTAGIYNKLNKILSNDLVSILNKHWGVMPVLKFAKHVPIIGTPADLVSIAGTYYNGANYGWSIEHKLDFAFSLVGTVPGYGDGASALYTGVKGGYNLIKDLWEDIWLGFYRFEQGLPTLFRY